MEDTTAPTMLTITVGGATYQLTPTGRQWIEKILALDIFDLLASGVLPDQLAGEEWDGEPLFEVVTPAASARGL